MLYADDAGIVSKSPEGPAKIMTVLVTVFRATGLTVSEKKIETDHAAADTEPGIPDLTARHRSSEREA